MSPDTRETIIERLRRAKQSAPYVEGYLVGYLPLFCWPCRWPPVSWHAQEFYAGQRDGQRDRSQPEGIAA
jgi:hypothetical protein